jgi:hypothetical protein
MIVRRLAARRLVKPGSTAEEPVRRRATRFVVVVFAAGVLSGAAAWLAFGPFGDVQGLVLDIFAGGPAQISAQEIFPKPAPTHRVVDVYDPPAPGTSLPAPPPSRAASTPPAERSSEPGDDGPGDG